MSAKVTYPTATSLLTLSQITLWTQYAIAVDFCMCVIDLD